MAEDDPGPLARELRRLMNEAGIGQKALALKAGVNETYVRDILKGRSRNPEAGKLGKVAAALGCAAGALHGTAGAPDTSELVRDPGELLLLATWRELPQEEREAVLDFIRYRLSRMDSGSPGRRVREPV
jgi:transcriptional regulator with XRE-family HTH domain